MHTDSMELQIRFEVNWSDNEMFEIQISAWDGRFGGAANVYVEIGGLDEAAARLDGFPHHPADIRELQFGAFGPESAGGAVGMRFYCADGAGHAFVEAKIESAFDKFHNAQSAIIIADVEPAAMDAFLSELRALEDKRHGVARFKLLPPRPRE